MFSTNSSADVTDGDALALGRALMTVAEQSFFTMVDPAPVEIPEIDGPMLNACVTFDGAFAGILNCRMPRRLAQELTAASSVRKKSPRMGWWWTTLRAISPTWSAAGG
jgi:hypothetical protein